jgi:hypothetical protein
LSRAKPDASSPIYDSSKYGEQLRYAMDLVENHQTTVLRLEVGLWVSQPSAIRWGLEVQVSGSLFAQFVRKSQSECRFSDLTGPE